MSAENAGRISKLHSPSLSASRIDEWVMPDSSNKRYCRKLNAPDSPAIVIRNPFTVNSGAREHVKIRKLESEVNMALSIHATCIQYVCIAITLGGK